MITNDAELQLTRKLLADAEATIEWYRERLLPHHEQNFNLYAGPWLDFRDQFQADIDAYLRSKTVPANGPTGPIAPTGKDLEPASDDRAGGNQVT